MSEKKDKVDNLEMLKLSFKLMLFLSSYGYFTSVESTFFSIPHANQQMKITGFFRLIVLRFHFIREKNHWTYQKWPVNLHDNEISMSQHWYKKILHYVCKFDDIFFPLFIPFKIQIMKHFILENFGLIIPVWLVLKRLPTLNFDVIFIRYVCHTFFPLFKLKKKMLAETYPRTFNMRIEIFNQEKWKILLSLHVLNCIVVRFNIKIVYLPLFCCLFVDSFAKPPDLMWIWESVFIRGMCCAAFLGFVNGNLTSGAMMWRWLIIWNLAGFLGE